MLSCRLNSTFSWKSEAVQANHFALLSRRKLGFGFPRAHLFLVPLLLQFSSLGVSAETRILPRGPLPWWARNSLSLSFFKLPALWNCQKSSFALKLPNSFSLLFSQLPVPCIHSFIFGKYLKWKYWCSWQPALEEENWIQTSEITLTCSLLEGCFLSNLPPSCPLFPSNHHNLHHHPCLNSHFYP